MAFASIDPLRCRRCVHNRQNRAILEVAAAGGRYREAAVHCRPARRDWATLAEVWHPEVEYVPLETDPDSATYCGVDDITKLFDGLAAPFSEFRVWADEIRDLGRRTPRVTLRLTVITSRPRNVTISTGREDALEGSRSRGV
jgi:hypothetical protein